MKNRNRSTSVRAATDGAPVAPPAGVVITRRRARGLGSVALVQGAFLVLTWVGTPGTGAADEYELARRRMVEEIRGDVEVTSRQIGRKALDLTVMQVMGRVPRHHFVPLELRRRAYENRPLPIGYGQTISQPYIVALMTDLLGLEPEQSVLEVGTGSGYQAAVLAEMGVRVYSVEIIPELGKQAAERLDRLGYDRVTTRIGDGYYGWEERAPFDAIIVTAAATHIPPPLVQQLKPEGIMVIPVGGPFAVQQLTLVQKSDRGQVRTRQILPVAFVPLTGGH